MKTRRQIDWLSITIPDNQNWRNFIPLCDLKRDGRGRHGYREAWRDARTGARIECASDREDMGAHITLSGDVLQAMRDDLGAVDDAIIERIGQWGAKCSRIDLALDIFGARLGPSMLRSAIINGHAKIRARTWRFIEGHRNGIAGDTLDTGSPASDVRLRFYDKRAERAIKDGEAWVRLEIQLRRLYARSTIEACAGHGVTSTIGATIGSYLTWSDTDYQAAIAGGEEFTMTIPRKQSKRQMWLLGQVAWALATELHDDPSFREKFDISVGYFMEQLDKLD